METEQSTHTNQQNPGGGGPDMQTNAPSAEPAQAPVALLAPVPFYKKNSFIAVVIVVVAGLVALYLFFGNSIGGGSIGTVNGLKISQADYDESVNILEQTAILQGLDLSSPETQQLLKDEALTVLINNALLITAAESANIMVTEGELDSKYQELVVSVGGAEALLARMEEVGLTETILRKNIRERVLADKYIASVTDIENISVAEEEIETFYNALSSSQGNIPPLEGIKTEIENQLRVQKQQQIIAEVLEKLTAEAKIDIRI